MVKHRNIFLGFLLTVITLGFYYLYWLISTKNEINKEGGKIPTGWLLLIPFVSIYWQYKYCDEFAKVILKKDNGWIYFLISILFWPAFPILVQSKLNKYSLESNKIGNQQQQEQQSIDSDNISEAELNAKQYIEQYKNQYSKESLKSALINSGNSEADVNNWLDKYF